MEAHQTEDGSAEGAEPGQEHTEASAGLNAENGEQDTAEAADKEPAPSQPVPEASLASGGILPDQASGTSPEPSQPPHAAATAEQPETAQPQMATNGEVQAQTTESIPDMSSGGNPAAVAAAEEPHPVAEVGSLTHALQDTHIDPEKHLANAAQPATPISEQSSPLAEEKAIKSTAMS